MIALLLAAALSASPPDLIPTPVNLVQAVPQDAPTSLEDVTVTGRRLENIVSDFVGEVAEPNRDRGLARWDRRVCVGVANLKVEAAQYIADRVSTVAEDLGLNPGAPGCAPNILIVATTDGSGLAEALVGERPRAFRMGGSGMDRGGSALDDFVQTERPVRWWQMAMPVDSESGELATRIPGYCRDDCDAVPAGQSQNLKYAPTISVFAASRLRTQIVDRLSRAIVIIDVDEVAGVSVQQLADYVAMVALTQVDPDADVGAFDSILNLFQSPDPATGLTNWDTAYLEGVYASEQARTNRRSNRTEVVDSIMRANRRLLSEAAPPENEQD